MSGVQMELFCDGPWGPRWTFDEQVYFACDWLSRRHGCTAEASACVRRLFEQFGTSEGFERAKALDVLDGRERVEGWTLADADALGLYDRALDYHTIWDRAWAARHGCPKHLVRLGEAYDYSGGRLLDPGGKVLWEVGAA